MLFQPGAGMPPPHLAGRESEQDYFTALLQQLRTGSGAPADVILTGPRGNGKTVLLRWLAQEATKATVPGGAAPETDVIWLTPTETRTEADLRERLLPPTLLQQLGERLRAVGVLGVKAELGEVADRAHYLGEALIARCRRKPLVVLLDEAHTLDIDVGRTLLNISQVVRPDAPFLLALAGTPDLPMRLNAMDVSFWTRARQMGVGRISPAAAADALAVPLNGAGVDIDPSALAAAVADSQCYPYFIQLWGEALWRQVRNTETATLEQRHVDNARPELSAQLTAFYELRWEELQTQRLLPVAERLAAELPQRSPVTESGLNDIIASALPDPDPAGIDAVRTALLHLGYVWRSPASRHWEPGIPSLMSYVQAHEE